MHSYFPAPLKLDQYPLPSDSCSPSPTKKRRVNSATNQSSDLLTSRLNSTLRLRDAWSDIWRRHTLDQSLSLSLNTTQSSSQQRKHRPAGRTRALRVEEDDIIDLKELRIVKDRGVLRNSRKGSFAIGGWIQESTEGRDTGNGFQIIDDDEGEGEEGWEDEEEGELSWEEPELDQEDDSEDEFAEMDLLQSLPSLEYREEKRKTEERKNELNSFLGMERIRAGSTNRINQEEEEEDKEDELEMAPDKSGSGKKGTPTTTSRIKPNLTLEKPMLPPQMRATVRREFLQSCTPQPQLKPPTSRQSRPDKEEEEEEDFEMTLLSSERNNTPIPSTSAIKRLSLGSTSTSQSYSSPPKSSKSAPSSKSATSILRNRIETLDLSISPPPPPSSSSPTPISRPLSSISRRSGFSRDSAPPPPPPARSRSNHLKPVRFTFLLFISLFRFTDSSMMKSVDLFHFHFFTTTTIDNPLLQIFLPSTSRLHFSPPSIPSKL